MIVLGYNGFARSAELFEKVYNRGGVDKNRILGHDASACIFIDGKLVAAVEEERLNREKKTANFPKNSLNWCLETAGINVEDIDLFSFPWKFDEEVMNKYMLKTITEKGSIQSKFEEMNRLDKVYNGVFAPNTIRTELMEQLETEISPEKILLVPHHLAHLMSGYYASGGGDMAFLVSDGRAELFSSISGEIREGNITIFEEASIDVSNSLGLLYSKVTRYLGFIPNNDEYKVMGLSAFGPKRPLTDNKLLEYVVNLKQNGKYIINIENALNDKQSYYSLFDQLFRPINGRTDFDFRVKVSSFVQDLVEKVTVHQIDALRQKTSMQRLIIEGGVALNCVNNSQVADNKQFKDVFVSFGASDSGVSIGSAYYPFFNSGISPVNAGSPYLGPKYTNQEVYKELMNWSDQIEWEYLRDDALISKVSMLLQESIVLAWFKGRAEYGPRSLGNRSILANPSFSHIQDLINKRVKKREIFRPFAPIILEERARHVFNMGDKLSSPYMTFTFSVYPEYRELIKGAVHVDGTSRIQTVSHFQNPDLASLLECFERETGLPCLINTSFNVAGEPIVCSPRDAIRCYLGTEIDYLVIENYLISIKRRHL